MPNDEIFYGCGDTWENEDASGVSEMDTQASYSAGIFKMNAEGRVKWFIKLAGDNPATNGVNQDRCYGLHVN